MEVNHILYGTNLIYVVTDVETNTSAVIDPTAAAPVLAFFETRSSVPKLILNTHSHIDHVGGNEDLVRGFEDLGHTVTILPFFVTPVLSLGSTKINIHSTPCHTEDSRLFFFSNPKDKLVHVFTGDTIFLGGCGKFFWGSGKDMLAAIDFLKNIGRIQALLGFQPNKENIVVNSGHDYAVENLEFANSVWPENEQIKDMLKLVKTAKSEKRVPFTTLVEEEKINVFFNCKNDALKNYLQKKELVSSDVSSEDIEQLVINALRLLKNKYKN